MTTLEYLNNYKILCNKVNHIWDKIQDIEERMTNVSPIQGDGSSHTCSISDKVGIGIAELDFLIKEYDAYVDLREDLKKNILNTVKQIPNKEYAAIIWLRYICFDNFDNITKKIHRNNIEYVRCKMNGYALREYTKYSIIT